MARAACPPPLAPTLVAVVLGSWLIPTWLQRSQDRQAELKVKADLVEQIATDTTTSVRHPIVLVLQHGAPESASPSASLKHEYFAAKQDCRFRSPMLRARVPSRS